MKNKIIGTNIGTFKKKLEGVIVGTLSIKIFSYPKNEDILIECEVDNRKNTLYYEVENVKNKKEAEEKIGAYFGSLLTNNIKNIFYVCYVCYRKQIKDKVYFFKEEELKKILANTYSKIADGNDIHLKNMEEN